MIAVSGEIVPGDGERFAAAVGQGSGGIVVLAGPGGSLDDGLLIGAHIRDRRMATAVLTGTECFSACALAWLGGTERMMQAGAAIGLHAAFDEDGAGVRRTSSVGNAMVGAYLTRLGYPMTTVMWATTAAPDRLLYLDEAVGAEIGIAFHRLPLAGATPRPLETALPSVAPLPGNGSGLEADLTAAAAEFVDAHFAAGNGANGNPAYVAARYAPRVGYFGADIPREEVLRQRAEYGARWPHTTIWRTAPPAVACDAAVTRCTITGPASFVATSPQRNARSEGALLYRFEVIVAGDDVVIVGEDSEAGARRTGAIDNGRLTPVQAIQAALERHGCAPGPVDGSWGRQSAAALERFARATGSTIDRRPPSSETLATLTRTRAPACLNATARRDGAAIR